MHMKLNASRKVSARIVLTTISIFAVICLVGRQTAFAQTAFYDFRFTPGQALPAGDSLAGNSLTIAPGTGPQTIMFDIWVTVLGGSTTDASKTGLEQADFRGFSQIVSGGGAFTTGTTGGSAGNSQVGAVSVLGLGAFAGHVSGHGAPTTTFADNGSTVGTTVSSTKDGIFDMGTVSTSTGDLALAMGGTGNTIFANNASATPAGGSSANGGGWQFDIGRITFNLGTASATDGAATSFVALNPVTASAAIVSINGGSTFQTLTSGTSFTPNANSSFNILRFVVAKSKGSASWNLNTNGNYSDLPNWDPNQIPDGAGLVATFGNGTTTAVNVPNITVTVDGTKRVGTLNFNNTNGTSFTLGNDGVAGHSLTLDNNGAGATVNSSTGNNWIFSNLVLADNATFNVAAGSSVLVSLGNISETGTSRSVTKTGAGTLTIDTASTYTGTTSVTAGTLVTTATGTLSTGPLVASAASGVTSLVSLNNNQTVSSLSGTVSGSGVATVSVASGTTLTVAQSTDTTFGGKLSLASSGGTLVKSGSGRLETQGAPTLGSGSVINVTGGTLRFNATSGAATIGTGVIATVSGTAVLELAGSVSALSSSGSPADRVNISNNSTAAAGLLVSGTNQQVGKIDGPGATSVAAGGSLTANHIVESALVIGGTASAPATVTIAASDASGNSLTESSGFASTNSLSSTAPSGTLSPSSLLAASGAPSSGPGLAGASVGGTDLGANSTAVPEPSALVLLVLGGMLAICLRKQLPAIRLR